MKTKINRQRPVIKTVITVLLLFFCFFSQAQLKGGHILGAMGLQSGTQTPANTISVIYRAIFIQHHR